MSLVRLLTTGKSLVGLGEPAARYRMRDRFLLPKFGSAPNPFAEAGGPKAVPAMTETATTPSPVAKYQMTPAELAAARLKETKRLPAVTIAAMQAADAQLAEAEAAMTPRFREQAAGLASLAVRAPIGWARGWFAKLNPLRLLDRRSAASKPPIPVFGKTPVQAELSLENIRVVRNDLNESEVELVPAKAVARPKAKQASEPAAPAPETAELIKT
jgi:hypothetical protein